MKTYSLFYEVISGSLKGAFVQVGKGGMSQAEVIKYRDAHTQHKHLIYHIREDVK